MKRFAEFAESAAEMANKAMSDKQQKFKQEGQAAVQKTRDDAERRKMNAKKKSLRDRMAARGISDDDGLLDDDED